MRDAACFDSRLLLFERRYVSLWRSCQESDFTQGARLHKIYLLIALLAPKAAAGECPLLVAAGCPLWQNVRHVAACPSVGGNGRFGAGKSQISTTGYAALRAHNFLDSEPWI